MANHDDVWIELIKNSGIILTGIGSLAASLWAAVNSHKAKKVGENNKEEIKNSQDMIATTHEEMKESRDNFADRIETISLSVERETRRSFQDLINRMKEELREEFRKEKEERTSGEFKAIRINDDRETGEFPAVKP